MKTPQIVREGQPSELPHLTLQLEHKMAFEQQRFLIQGWRFSVMFVGVFT